MIALISASVSTALCMSASQTMFAFWHTVLHVSPA